MHVYKYVYVELLYYTRAYLSVFVFKPLLLKFVWKEWAVVVCYFPVNPSNDNHNP